MLKMQPAEKATSPLLMSRLHDNPVTLKPLSSRDISFFMKWAMDDEVTRTLTWSSYKNEKDAHYFLENIAEKHPWLKAICHGDKIVGSISLDTKSLFDEKVAEVGYVIARDFWGQGFATAALQVAIEQCFNDLGVPTIVAFVDPNHIASQRVLEKSGFKLEAKLLNFREVKGELKDRLLYKINVKR